MVEFVSYTGKYPNLCRGILTLKIDGKEVKFGHDYSIFESWKTDGNYDEFWASGGSAYFENDYADTYVESGNWIIYADDIPEQYRQYAEEIYKVFNANVKSGCCGGCL